MEFRRTYEKRSLQEYRNTPNKLARDPQQTRLEALVMIWNEVAEGERKGRAVESAKGVLTPEKVENEASVLVRK